MKPNIQTTDVSAEPVKHVKALRVEKVEGSGLVKVAYEGGGEVPDELKSHYTSSAEAHRAIAVHQANKSAPAPAE